MSPDEYTEMRLDIARLDGKVDVAITGHGGRIDQLEAKNKDQEDRLRTVERRSFVRPRHIYYGVVLACTVLGVAVSAIALLA